MVIEFKLFEKETETEERKEMEMEEWSWDREREDIGRNREETVKKKRQKANEARSVRQTQRSCQLRFISSDKFMSDSSQRPCEQAVPAAVRPLLYFIMKVLCVEK